MKQLFIFVLLVFISSGFSSKKFGPLANTDKEVVCFVYHRFGDHRYPSTNTSVSDFEAHLSYLKKNNFEVLTFSDAIDYIKSDGPARKVAVITIDDGYKSFYKNGLPLMKKYKMPGTLFINTKSVAEKGDMMSWSEIKGAMESGIEIGNHTHSHNFFLNENKDTRYKSFRDEVELSQTIIKKNLDFTPVIFTFPYGEFDPEMKKIVKELGFKAAAAQNSGVMFASGDLFMCPRFPMSESYSAIKSFAEKASMKAIHITKADPDSFVLGSENPPTATLIFETNDINPKHLKCFVDGHGCTLKVVSSDDKLTTITVQSNEKLKKRRTPYKVTVLDKKGVWRWYSHLWIIPSYKDE